MFMVRVKTREFPQKKKKKVKRVGNSNQNSNNINYFSCSEHLSCTGWGLC